MAVSTCGTICVVKRRHLSTNACIPLDLHAAVAAAAAADGKSLNQWVADELRASVAGSG